METIEQRNIKFESFLKRELNNNLFRRIRSYEVGIVKDSQNDKLRLHYLVLTDEQLLLFDYPAKHKYQIIQLASIETLKVVGDHIDFLQSPYREEATHFRLEYLDSSSPDLVLSCPSETTTAPPKITISDHTPSGNNSSEDDSTSYQDIHPSKTILSFLSSGLGNIRRRSLQALARKSRDTTEEADKIDSMATLSPSRDPVDKVCTKHGVKRISRSMSVLEHDQRSLSFKFPSRAPSLKDDASLVLPNYKHTKRKPVESEISVCKPPDIYVLRISSPLKNKFELHWRAALIKSCEPLRYEMSERPNRSSRRDKVYDPLFRQLSGEIRDATDWSNKAELLHELKLGVSRNPELKVLFWKDKELQKCLSSELKQAQNCDSLLATEENDVIELIFQSFHMFLEEFGPITEKIQSLLGSESQAWIELFDCFITAIVYSSTTAGSTYSADNSEECTTMYSNKSANTTASSRLGKSALGAVYELLTSVQNCNANGVSNATNFLKNYNLNPFISILLAHLFSLITDSSTDEFGFEACVFRHLSVILKLIEVNQMAKDYVVEKYQEEIRYYLNSNYLQKKVNCSHPMRYLILDAVNKFNFWLNLDDNS